MCSVKVAPRRERVPEAVLGAPSQMTSDSEAKLPAHHASTAIFSKHGCL